MNMTLTRIDDSELGIFGTLDPDDESFLLQTLEHAYQFPESITWQPKVPAGIYTCLRGLHRLPGMSEPFFTFEITDVPGHTNILFHPGNTESDSSGCVLLGLTREGSSILKSRDAFNLFMNSLVGVESFQLKVI